MGNDQKPLEAENIKEQEEILKSIKAIAKDAFDK